MRREWASEEHLRAWIFKEDYCVKMEKEQVLGSGCSRDVETFP